MNLSHLTSDTLRNLIPPTEKRDELLKNLQELESEIVSALTGSATAVAEPLVQAKAEGKENALKAAAKGRSVRGALKGRILALLEEAGTAGLGVQEIADKLGVKVGNVYVWFSSTGKALTAKVAPGRYTVKKSPAPAAGKKSGPVKAAAAGKAIKPAVKAKSATAKPVKAKRNISPEARAKMAAAAKARWEKLRAAKSESKPAVPAKPAKTRKSSKPAKKAPKAVKKGFKLPAPE